MFCPKCGYENSNENLFCMSCGQPFKHSSEINEQEQPVQNVRTCSKRNNIVIGIIAAIVAVVIGGVLIYETVGKSTQNSDDFIAISNAQVSDTVRFGKYEWYVIDKWGNYCTLLCKDVVAEKAYNVNWLDDSIMWASCSLRQWLNNDFYNEFSNIEKDKIVSSNCINNTDNRYGINSGIDTNDKVFLLSVDEAELLDLEQLKCTKWWWLRTLGSFTDYGAGVHSDGQVHTHGSCVDIELGVRPAIVIELN